MGGFFLKNLYLYEFTFKNQIPPQNQFLTKPNLSIPHDTVKNGLTFKELMFVDPSKIIVGTILIYCQDPIGFL